MLRVIKQGEAVTKTDLVEDTARVHKRGGRLMRLKTNRAVSLHILTDTVAAADKSAAPGSPGLGAKLT